MSTKGETEANLLPQQTVSPNGIDEAENNNKASNKTYLPDTLSNEYSTQGSKMPYLYIYRAFPFFWLVVGRYYRDFDVAGGVLFILGSIGFFVLPILSNYQAGSDTQLNIAMIVSVALFLLAKVVLESRAVYAMLWKRAHKRPSWLYHAAIWVLIFAGLLFMLVPIFQLAELSTMLQGTLDCISSFLFLLGTGLFTLDGAEQLHKPLFTNVNNQYFWGSLSLFLGSVLFVVAGLCETTIGRVFLPDGSIYYRNGSGCNEDLVNWGNGIGGLFFIVGSVSFLVFAIAERGEMHSGPDPRTCTREGHEEPHPYHHEKRHTRSDSCP